MKVRFKSLEEVYGVKDLKPGDKLPPLKFSPEVEAELRRKLDENAMKRFKSAQDAKNIIINR